MNQTANPGKPSQHLPVRSLPISLRVFLFAALGLTIVSLLYSAIARLCGAGLPYSFSYIFIPGAFFSDFSEFWVRFAHFGTPRFFQISGYFMYPPGITLPIEAFYATSHPLKYFLLFLVATGLFFTVCFYRILRKQQLGMFPSALLSVGALITSYPYLMLLQRWNTEIFIWVAVTFGLWSFYRGRYAWAAVWIGLATAFKLYPLVFLGLFLPRRRYREFALGIVVAIAVTIIALRAWSPDLRFALAWDSEQLQAFGKYYAAAPHNLSGDHSLLSLIKFFTLPWHPDLSSVIRPFTRLVAITCIVLYFLRIWRMPLISQVLILSVLSVSIPPISFDYTLLSLYPVLAMLCVTALNLPEHRQRELIPHFLLLAAILTPESYLIVHGIPFAGQFRTVCLLALLVLALRRPLPSDSPAPVDHSTSTLAFDSPR